jgi:type I restriction enzyme R subunit
MTIDEDAVSQAPALQVLQALGYVYLTPAEALERRGGRRGTVILDAVLEKQLRKINRITTKGEEHAFSEANLQSAVQALKSEPYDGLIRTNEKLYDLLCLGKAMQQSIYGDSKSFTLNYIDWEHPENNAFHVTEEFAVERSGSHEARRPDLVLFVNGIPFAIIECKSPTVKDAIEQAISQHLRNQRDDEVPHLFLYAQVLLALSKNEARYATVGTAARFWSAWKEDVDEAELQSMVDRSLPVGVPRSRGSLPDASARMAPPARDAGAEAAAGLPPEGGTLTEVPAEHATSTRLPTPQDRALVALCRPGRLLELSRRFILFEAGEKKIARYQQYFCVRTIMARIRQRDEAGRRQGGVVWHTQGSGKSLTMVFLAKALALAPDLADHKIVIVTDRIDLDDQIHKTFMQTGHEPVQARSGWGLGELLTSAKAQIITTIIDKFEAALGKAEVRNESPNIFVLVDESHRSQYGPRHAKMRKALPNACYIGFTGTPLLQREKNTAVTFGGLIQPSYTIQQAVEDGAVVPLLYEGRHVPQDVDAVPLDTWFEKYTEGLTPEQRADLKRKCSGTSQVQKSKQTIMRIAWDVSRHYRDTWQGTPYRGQLVTMSKAAALRYKGFLNEFGMVSCEVLISGPDDREGNEDVFDENTDEVIRFWKQMMAKYGSEKEYNRQLINAFKHGEQPEIIIVVDKLLTGFDAPCNTVMYLHKPLAGHSLLQAIARVNRLCEGKDFGYIIDYYGVLGKLDEALDLYGELPGALAGFDQEEIQEALSDIRREVAKLPQRHAELWDTFKSLPNQHDEEAFEVHLGDEARRSAFYERLALFARTLQVALSSVSFIETTTAATIERYRGDLRFFCSLRTAVRRRYAEVVDFREYERRVQKLIDTHVGTREVESLTGLVNIFNAEAFEKEVERIHGAASKADTIAHRTKRTLSEKWEKEDPAFYKKFSRMIEETIEAFHQHRISDAEYLSKVTEVLRQVRDHTDTDIPPDLTPGTVPAAFYGEICEALGKYTPQAANGTVLEAQEEAGRYTTGPGRPPLAVRASLEIDRIVRELRIVNWQNNPDVKNRMRTAIEDMLFGLKDEYGIAITFEDIDEVMEKCLEIARVRYPS